MGLLRRIPPTQCRCLGRGAPAFAKPDRLEQGLLQVGGMESGSNAGVIRHQWEGDKFLSICGSTYVPAWPMKKRAPEGARFNLQIQTGRTRR